MKTTLEARKIKRSGDLGERQAANLLRLLGVLNLQRIATPWRIVRCPRTHRIVSAHPLDRVAGDFTGVLPGGRGVLVEVKRRPDSLAWGDLEPHQHGALLAQDMAGGLALVVWCAEAHILAMEYGRMCGAGWRNGSPLHLEAALALHIATPFAA